MKAFTALSGINVLVVVFVSVLARKKQSFLSGRKKKIVWFHLSMKMNGLKIALKQEV